MTFENRSEAGRRLGEAVVRLAAGEMPPADSVVVALPRGGVPVGYWVAEALSAPLDVIMVRKLGAPGQPELAIGAIGEGGVRVLSDDLVRRLGVSDAHLDEIAARESAELDRRLTLYRSGRPALNVAGRDVVLVDDGIATGATARAACAVLRRLGAGRIVLAVPVAPPDTLGDMVTSGAVDFGVAVEKPRHMRAIGFWYRDFVQTSDNEVIDLLLAAGGGEAP